jgi:hypothetical protein
MASSIHITIDALPGVSPPDALAEALSVAKKLRTGVLVRHGGREVILLPGSSLTRALDVLEAQRPRGV